MSLQSACDQLCTDLHALESRMLASGWPVRARLRVCGVSGRPGSHATGLFLRFNAEGEEYVFTMTGPTAGIERFVAYQHRIIERALSQEWPGYDAMMGPRRTLQTEPLQDGDENDDSMQGTIGYDSQESDPTPRRSSDRRLRQHHTFSIQRRPDGLWTACVSIPVKGGPLYLCATADEHAVAQAIHGELASISGDRSWVGNDKFRAVCGDVAQARATERASAALRQIAASPAAHACFGSVIPIVRRDVASGFDISDVGKVFTQVVADPQVQKVFATLVPAIPIVGQPAAAAFQVARAAMGVVDKVNAGDPKVTNGVKVIVAEAKKGNPQAISALKAIKMAQKIKKGQAPMMRLPDPRDEKIKALEAANRELQMKLDASKQKWDKNPLDAADDVLDLWGGQDDFLGPDSVQATGKVVGTSLEAVGGARLARPVVSSYYRRRLPVGRIDKECTPEVGAIYHRPMRESADASLRRDYLRGSALQGAGFPEGRHFLSWPHR